MSEIDMVERVARAIQAVRGPKENWDRVSEKVRELWLNDARAAIEAMREPTEAMIEAARVAWRARHAPMATGRDGRGDGGGLGTLSRPGWETEDYQVMIDAALVSPTMSEKQPD